MRSAGVNERWNPREDRDSTSHGVSGRRRTPLHAARVGRGRQDAGARVAGDGAQAALGPGVADGHVVAAPAQLGDDLLVHPRLDGDRTRPHAAREEGPGNESLCPVRVDRALEVEAARARRRAAPHARKKCTCHWSCWSPPGVPNARTGTPSLRARDGVRVAGRAAAGGERVGQALVEPGHTAAGCRGGSRARAPPGWTGASRRTGWRRPCCPSGSTMSRWRRCRRGSGRPRARRARPAPGTPGSGDRGLARARDAHRVEPGASRGDRARCAEPEAQRAERAAAQLVRRLLRVYQGAPGGAVPADSSVHGELAGSASPYQACGRPSRACSPR